MAKFRKGDVVTVQATIDSDYVLDGGKIKVRIEPYHDIFVLLTDMSMVQPMFEVGDVVAWETHDGADSWTGRILSISGEHLWCLLDDGSFATVWASKAQRVEPEAPADQADAA